MSSFALLALKLVLTTSRMTTKVTALRQSRLCTTALCARHLTLRPPTKSSVLIDSSHCTGARSLRKCHLRHYLVAIRPSLLVHDARPAALLDVEGDGERHQAAQGLDLCRVSGCAGHEPSQVRVGRAHEVVDRRVGVDAALRHLAARLLGHAVVVVVLLVVGVSIDGDVVVGDGRVVATLLVISAIVAASGA